jgi:hypothetical protein
MRFTVGRLYLLASITALVAVMFPGLYQYLTTEVCLEVGYFDSTGVTSCPHGSVRMDVADARWFQMPTLASTAVALLVAVLLVSFFGFRDRWTRSHERT